MRISGNLNSKRKAISSDGRDQMPPPPSRENLNSSSPSSANTQTVASNFVSNEGTPNEGTPSPTSLACASKKVRSEVWVHFVKLKDDQGNEIGRAKCVYCSKDYLANSEQGTSGLWKHLRDTCKKFPNKKEFVEAYKSRDKMQKILNFQKASESEKSKLSCWQFDQQACRDALVKMIIKDELPFWFVEGEGFREFIQVSLPMFQIPSRYTIARDCYYLFVQEKKKLHALLTSQCQRVSLITDTWTSIQNVSYLCLTAHFIDSGWNLHKRILNFCVVKSHKGINIGNAIDFCMDEWGLNKVMCITVDNASSNDTAVQQLKKKLTKKNAFVLGGEAFHMRCFAHILQLVVKDGLESAQYSIRRIRDVVKYVRGSPQRLEMFKKCCESANIKSKASLQLDCPTRWNSTYLMLESAVVYQKAFDKLEDVDSKFLGEFGNDMPSEVDWTKARNLTRFLKRFYDVTCKISGSLYSTSNMYFPEIMRVLKDLQAFQSSNDLNLAEMGRMMREKFDKYWGSIQKMNVMLFIVVVLDPRYKMDYLAAKYKSFYSENDANDLVTRVTNSLRALMDEYKGNEQVGMGGVIKPSNDVEDMVEDEELDDYFIEREKEQSLVSKGELDRYFGELPEKYTHDFDLLNWWKVNAVRYPILSKVAKDVLAIQSSTVASESAFSTGGRTLDRFRSSLTPTTAEVLICCQDWLRSSSKPIQLEETIEDLESLESGMILL